MKDIFKDHPALKESVFLQTIELHARQEGETMSDSENEIKIGGPVSIGPLIKKINEINPELNAREVIGIVNQSKTRGQDGKEKISEELALELARRTLKK